MTIRISSDFSSFVAIDDEHASHVVPLDGRRDMVSARSPYATNSPLEGPQWVVFPAFAADPGFRLVPDSAAGSFFPR